MRIASDIWCPYICDNETGYVVELTKRAFNSQGYEVDFVTFPYKRALVEVQKNNVDAVLAVTGKAMKDYDLVSGDIIVGYNSNDFFTATDSDKRFYHLDDLAKVNQIAVITGYHYGKELNQWLRKNPNTFYASGDTPLADNIVRLVKRRHSAILDNRSVIEHTASLLNLKNDIRYAGTMGEPDPLFIGFNQHKKAIVSVFVRGIEQLKISGEYQAILDKYNITFDNPDDPLSIDSEAIPPTDVETDISLEF